MVLASYDRDALKNQFLSATPFPFVEIEPFLTDDFAREVAASYPSFGEAAQAGDQFSFVNEKGKIQVTDAERFPDPVKRLSDAISSEEFLRDLEHITGIPRLLADGRYAGGGMHLTGPRGRLDVHVDFNYDDARAMHRRLNLLLYLNPEWKADWGGAVEFWDDRVKKCHHSFRPTLNRCVIFETSEISYHGVEPVTCPAGVARQSFAAYYYTKEAPAGWDGQKHSTIFRARPDERLRGYVFMPLEKIKREGPDKVRRGVKWGLRAGAKVGRAGIELGKSIVDSRRDR